MSLIGYKNEDDHNILIVNEKIFFQNVSNQQAIKGINNELSLYTSATHRMIIDDTGNIGMGTTNPAKVLDITSTTSGFLPPRMTTTQRNAMTPIAGEIIYNNTDNKLQCYNGTIWNNLF